MRPLNRFFDWLDLLFPPISEKFHLAARRISPNRISPIRRLIRIAEKRGDRGSVCGFIGALLEIEPENPAHRLEKARLLFENGRNSEAEKLFCEIHERNPDHPGALRGLVQLARRNGDRGTELTWMDELQRVSPLAPEMLSRKGVLLGELGECEKAERLLARLIEKQPDEPSALRALAIVAATARNYDLARDRWEKLCEVAPRDTDARASHIRSLIKTAELDEAQSILDQQSKALGPVTRALLQSALQEARLDWGPALETIQAARAEAPGSLRLALREARLRMMMAKRFGAPLEPAESLIREAEQRFPADRNLRTVAAELHLLQGNLSAAAAEIDRLPDTREQRIMELKAWNAHFRGNEHEAKQIWEEILRTHHVPHVKPPREKALRREDSKPLSIQKGEILLFTVFRNEKWRLPWFLDYYRSLGVDRFFFIDNDSGDGSREYLLEQPDNVHVFWTSDHYGEACSGMQWINELVKIHGNEHWCLHVDVDEALVFPGVEESNLAKLTDYMEKKGHEALFAFMNDMFAEKEPVVPETDGHVDFIADYPLFDNHYHFSNVLYCPYQFVSGGVRRQFGFGEILTKTPLIRGGRGIKFLMSSHRITPAVISDVTGILLHFKLAGNYRETFLADAGENTRIPECKRRHAAYAKGLSQWGDRPQLSSDATLRYSSSEQLLELGLLKSSPEFLP